jgi:hypothetical protein
MEEKRWNLILLSLYPSTQGIKFDKIEALPTFTLTNLTSLENYHSQTSPQFHSLSAKKFVKHKAPSHFKAPTLHTPTLTPKERHILGHAPFPMISIMLHDCILLLPHSPQRWQLQRMLKRNYYDMAKP